MRSQRRSPAVVGVNAQLHLLRHPGRSRSGVAADAWHPDARRLQQGLQGDGKTYGRQEGALQPVAMHCSPVAAIEDLRSCT